MWWHSLGRLRVDEDGGLWHWDGEDLRHLGPIGHAAAYVPDDLAGEAAELLDLWEDAFDARAEADWTYNRTRGDFRR